jgi:pimeloyl-ACP methyl ester carboxylesterase
MLREYIGGAAFKPLPADIEERLERPWLLSKGGRQGSVGFIRQIAQAAARDVEEVEGRYQEVGSAIPVKVIWGVEDRWIPVERAEELARKIGARENVLIEDAGHLVMVDQPERVTVEIMGWLMRVTRGG